MTWSEKAIAFYHRKFDGYDIEQYMIMAVVCSIFLPFFCSLTVIALTLLYLLWKGRLYSIIRSYPKAYPVYGFCVLSWGSMRIGDNSDIYIHFVLSF